MIPLSDHNPTRRLPVVTLLIMGLCTYVYFFVQPLSDAGGNLLTSAHDNTAFTLSHAAVPCELVRGRPLDSREVLALDRGDTAFCERQQSARAVFPRKDVWLAVVWSMFLHASLLHIGGNLLFLWIFGNNIEDRIGPGGFALFYLAAGVAATATFVALQPVSTIPLVGASGAIAGVMGAYLILFPNVPAWIFLVLWFVEQFFVSPSAGVAWTAHVGGFVFGIVAGLLWRGSGRAARPALSRSPGPPRGSPGRR